jgi:hypothetical protein
MAMMLCSLAIYVRISAHPGCINNLAGFILRESQAQADQKPSPTGRMEMPETSWKLLGFRIV